MLTDALADSFDSVREKRGDKVKPLVFAYPLGSQVCFANLLAVGAKLDYVSLVLMF